MVLGYFISLFQFYLIILKKRTCLGTLLILNHFRSFYLFLQWSWVIWFHLFSPFKFFLIQFYFVIFKKERKCSRTLSFFNYFRCKCLFVPWSWVIIFCLFDNTFFFSIQFNSIQFNTINFNSILFIHIWKKDIFKNIVNFELFQI